MALGQKTIGRATDKTKELRQCWRTPRQFFDQLDAIFGFTVDACASAENALLDTYWTATDDARLQDWSQHRVYCNPPFGELASFLAKAPTAEMSLFVLPSISLTTRYFGQYQPTLIAIPSYRIKFEPPVGMNVEPAGATLGSVLLLYGDVSKDELQRFGALFPVWGRDNYNVSRKPTG